MSTISYIIKFMICSIQDCNDIARAKGLCKLHYTRNYFGIPLDRPRLHRYPSLLDVPVIKSREYRSWASMKTRCYNSNEAAYKNYGGRGIRVCEGWRTSFLNFYADMGKRPKNRTLDRKNNDGHYSCGKCPECIKNGWPMNCKWSTRRQQALNTRTVKNAVNAIKGPRIFRGKHYLSTKKIKSLLEAGVEKAVIEYAFNIKLKV
jgi:hypothetical protein